MKINYTKAFGILLDDRLYSYEITYDKRNPVKYLHIYKRWLNKYLKFYPMPKRKYGYMLYMNGVPHVFSFVAGPSLSDWTE